MMSASQRQRSRTADSFFCIGTGIRLIDSEGEIGQTRHQFPFMVEEHRMPAMVLGNCALGHWYAMCGGTVV